LVYNLVNHHVLTLITWDKLVVYFYRVFCLSFTLGRFLQNLRKLVLLRTMSVAADDLFKLLLALVLGGLIGWERELYDKPAGFRTNTLICVGSTLFTIFSLKIGIIPGTDSARMPRKLYRASAFWEQELLYAVERLFWGLLQPLQSGLSLP
jgi:MgtC family